MQEKKVGKLRKKYYKCNQIKKKITLKVQTIIVSKMSKYATKKCVNSFLYNSNFA